MVRQIKQEKGIYCKRHKRFKVTTDSNHNKPVYPNLLEQQFDVAAPNIAWVSDITYIWTNEGWVYLTAVKDLYSKQRDCRLCFKQANGSGFSVPSVE